MMFTVSCQVVFEDDQGSEVRVETEMMVPPFAGMLVEFSADGRELHGVVTDVVHRDEDGELSLIVYTEILEREEEQA